MSQLSPAQIKIQKDKQNIVSSRLEGKWIEDKQIHNRLNNTIVQNIILTFRSDEEALKQISKKDSLFYGKKITYMAGFMNIDGEEYPFILQEHNGIPTIVCFDKLKGNDYMKINVSTMLVVAEKTQNDLLFICDN